MHKPIQEGEMRKWRPGRAQVREFAQRMEDPKERAAYEERKRSRGNRRRATSKFDYNTAGGSYIPTREQHDFCFNNMEYFITGEEVNAANMVMYGYTCNEKASHDDIHIVNEIMRKHEGRLI